MPIASTLRRIATGAVALGCSLVVLPPGPALAASPDIVISQVYGGGGNSGAPYANDFIELFNRGGSAVALTGWTVQYASAGGSSWSTTALVGILAPGSHFLVREGSGGAVGAPLPTPDVTGGINMSATSGKVALVTTATALSCSTGCATQPGVRDFVGYGGSATSSETAPTANLANTTAALRLGGGATDTDDNSADFVVGAPDPRGSGGGPASARIHDIQAAGHVSPFRGTAVTGVAGVVTAKDSNGFWMQDPQPDADPATSEGIYVFVGSTPGQQVGDSVTVAATVAEFRPGADTGNLTITELTGPSVTTLATGVALPAPTVVGAGGRVPPGSVIDDDATGDVETGGLFQPDTDGVDFWESLEGMRVRLDDAAVVGPRNDFGEIPAVPAGSATRTARGGIVLQAADPNPERVLLDDLLVSTPFVDVGDVLPGATVGVLSYSFGNFKLQLTATPAVANGGLAAETTQSPAPAELTLATFNVENLDPGDPQGTFDRLASQLVDNLRSPDLVALEEVQDNNGPTNNKTVAANQTLNKLVAAIADAGGPAYAWRQINPVDDADGGEPGGNIRQVFLFRTDRGLSFVDRPGGTATSATSVSNVGGQPRLTFSPGRVDPTNAAFTNSRKPLAVEFEWNGQTVFAIANHFNSKGGDDPLFGRHQPPSRPSETQRHQQATVVRTFVDQILAIDADARVVVLGDLNDFEYSQTVSILTAGGVLVDLPQTLPVAQRYTYVFEGNSQVLDHILVSASLAATAYAYDIVHTNSEFADQASDHDPQVARIPLA